MNVKTQDYQKSSLADSNQTILLHVDQGQSLPASAAAFLQQVFAVTPESPDVHLINQEQESIKIAQVRALKQLLSYHPYQAKKTIVCLLWADLATQAAQHALLKSLEEPPAQSQCILVTHHPSALLPTIQSRCLEVSMSQAIEETVPGSGEQTQTNFPTLEDVLTTSYSQTIELATTYKDRSQALALVRHLLKQLHQSPNYPQPKLVVVAQELLKTQQLLEKNLNVQLALESCFFSIVSYNRGAVKNKKS